MTSRCLRSVVLAALPLALVAQTPAPATRPQEHPAPVLPIPGGLKPFSDVVKEAKELPGLFPLWQKDDKVWIELKPEQLDKPFFLAVSTTQGVGERGLYGGMMDRTHVVQFKRIGNTLQMLAKNLDFTAKEGTPIARAVKEGFSDSLLGFAPVLSQPHPDRKSFLVEANALFLADIPMAATQLELIYRQPYALDRANSSFAKVRATADMDTFSVSAHFALAKLILPPVSLPGAPPMPFTPLPGTLEDVRSLFLGYHYSLSKLPEPMQPRAADERVGYFTTTHWDFTHDLNPDPKVRFVNRWRLEKQDPAAALSEPKQPIVYWLDRNMPEKYRPAVTAGILEWNRAFEKIGFKDAVQVKVQPADAEWDTHDTRHASVRWLVGTDIGFAIGPSHVDPRTGEILDADIGVGEIWTRNPRRTVVEELPRPMAKDAVHACAYEAEASQEMGFAMDLLEARGDLEPDSPEADAYVMAVLKDVITHEVGHTLGLRHNFRASTIYANAQLQDAAFTKANGLTGSVMDYNALNIAAKGEKQGEYVMSTLGPYDFWAIEYAYKPLEASSEKAELAKIAARSHTEPRLAYGTDEEAGYSGIDGMDPEVNRRDLGADPLGFYKKRLQLSRELWDRLQDKRLKDDESYAVLRRTFEGGLGQVGLAANLTAKYVGGVVHLRDHAGSPRAPFTPVSAERQREAVKLLEVGLFSADAFAFRPEFMARLTVNQFERGFNPDFSLSTRLLGLQRMVLTQLMQPGVATRILDATDKMADPKAAFRLSELFEALQSAIWSELKTGKEAPALRRNLQKEHLRNLVGLVLRANPATPEDARALSREGLKTLAARLRTAGTKPGYSKETKAHFAECLASIEETLKPSVTRMSL
ncbi:zinc-dependent metalloprotease [Geothrix sp. 21YS21S-4]|uniref:zinc-dependent metalloprotease n=1 Tax=Geothrix sp. 21YS21S-4 TaxID=3068889 RepID=UPI0027B89687|nr:zinc-dependent metalloprotease [Geothrix sp. 21YS21S-4]